MPKGPAGDEPGAEHLGRPIPNPATRHHAAYTEPGDVARSLRAIWSCPRLRPRLRPVTAHVLRVQASSMLRPGEVRVARWQDIDVAERLWKLPPELTKGGKRGHCVPLTDQLAATGETMRETTGDETYVVATPRNDGRAVSRSGMRRASSRTLAIPEREHVPHGVRTTARTDLAEAGRNFAWT
ncbi:MAG: tyrosine-type recombinase/integrase, partial [Shimia sp.]